MAHFLIAQVKVNDDSWIPDYAAKVHDIVHRHGGKFLTRSDNIRSLEGEAPNADLVAMIRFPAAEQMQAFLDDPDYAPFAAARQKGTNSVMFAVDETDAAGTISYLS
jgi:uncharacterized protein (DUF1330 family)